MINESRCRSIHRMEASRAESKRGALPTVPLVNPETAVGIIIALILNQSEDEKIQTR